jgi:hypothetical protein
VFLRSQCKGIDVDTSVGGTGVVLPGLDNVEVRTLTLREAVLAVELELGSDNGVLTPAVHVKSSLREDEGTSIRDKGTLGVSNIIERNFSPLRSSFGSSSGGIKSTRHLEKTRCIDESILVSRDRVLSTESMDGVGEGINGISVVEGLGSKSTVEDTSSI